ERGQDSPTERQLQQATTWQLHWYVSSDDRRYLTTRASASGSRRFYLSSLTMGKGAMKQPPADSVHPSQLRSVAPTRVFRKYSRNILTGGVLRSRRKAAANST